MGIITLILQVGRYARGNRNVVNLKPLVSGRKGEELRANSKVIFSHYVVLLHKWHGRHLVFLLALDLLPLLLYLHPDFLIRRHPSSVFSLCYLDRADCTHWLLV